MRPSPTNSGILLSISQLERVTPSVSVVTLMQRGEEAAPHHWEALVKLKEKIGIEEAFVPDPHGPYHALQAAQKVRIKKIVFSGGEQQDK